VVSGEDIHHVVDGEVSTAFVKRQEYRPRDVENINWTTREVHLIYTETLLRRHCSSK
jgi:hypothetical protein